MEENKIFELYTLTELAYEKHFINMVDNREDLYPLDWYSLRDYKKKIQIIGEALEKNILINDTDKYRETKECVRHN